MLSQKGNYTKYNMHQISFHFVVTFRENNKKRKCQTLYFHLHKNILGSVYIFIQILCCREEMQFSLKMFTTCVTFWVLYFFILSTIFQMKPQDGSHAATFWIFIWNFQVFLTLAWASFSFSISYRCQFHLSKLILEHVAKLFKMQFIFTKPVFHLSGLLIW